MTLKQVVFPAPFGPMRPRISPSWMWKLTSSSAVRPPKRSVTASTSSSFLSSGCCCSLIAHPSRDGETRRGLLGQLAGTDRASRWQQTLRSVHGQQHQADAENDDPPVLEGPEALGEIGDHDRSDDHAPAVALAADDHRGDEQDG